MAETSNSMQQQLGNYRLVRLLGHGGFADVYLAEHIHLNTFAAVKLLHTRLAQDDIEEFRHEARLIAHLIHPHIVRVFDFGVENNLPYLVMDYAPDGTLRQHHPKGSMLPLDTVIHYVKQVAEALQYAHDQKLIHRDIKPENMLLGHHHEVLLSDFGIALATQSSHYQSTQNIAGTVAYMAPEQLQAHPRPASDQYSLAIVAYEWLCGYRPFQGSFSEIAVKHTFTPPPPLRPRRPDVPAAVEMVIMTALQKEPQQRFPNVRAFAQALEHASSQRTEFYTTQSPSSFQKTMMPSTFLYSNAPSTSHLPIGNRYPTQPVPELPPRDVLSTRRVPRRAFIGGMLGLATIGGGISWYVATHSSQAPSSILPKLNTTPKSGNPGTHPSSFTYDTPVLTYSEQQNYVWAVDWSPNGRYIASGSLDGSTHVWTATKAQRILSYRSTIKPAMSDDYVMGVAWSPDSTKVAMAFIDGTIQVVDVASGEMVYMFGSPHTAPYYGVSWSPSGDHIVGACSDDSVKVYEVKSGNLITTFTKHTDFVFTAVWSYNGKSIASGSSDGKVKVWNPFTAEELLDYTGHTGEIRSVAWSHDSTRIVSVSWDNTAKVWDATTGNTHFTYSEQPIPQMMDAAAWSHHDTYIALGSHDQYLRICDATTGKVVSSIVSNPAYSISWSPDDAYIVTGGVSDSTKRVQVWKVR